MEDAKITQTLVCFGLMQSTLCSFCLDRRFLTKKLMQITCLFQAHFPLYAYNNLKYYTIAVKYITEMDKEDERNMLSIKEYGLLITLWEFLFL